MACQLLNKGQELGRVKPEVCNHFIAGIQSKIPAAVALEDVF